MILAEVNALGDPSNINPLTGLPCAQPAATPMRLSRIVPFDNNLGFATFRVR
jgi:hypothetical protein